MVEVRHTINYITTKLYQLWHSGEEDHQAVEVFAVAVSVAVVVAIVLSLIVFLAVV